MAEVRAVSAASTPGRARLRRLALVLALGTALLGAALTADPPKLAWSDEIIYALVGRHIADGHGNVSSVTHPLSLAARGYPHPDVHLPGHMYLIAAAYKLLGVSEAAALAPSLFGYLGCGLVLYLCGGRHFAGSTGALAAILFFVFPPNLSYANSAMAESTLQLASGAYLAVWLEAITRPHRFWLLCLGTLLGLGTFHRETFLVFVPSALWALRAWPAGSRVRAAAWLLTPFLLLLGGLVAPAYLAKAPFPHDLSQIARAGWPERVDLIRARAIDNLRAAQFFGAGAWQWCTTAELGLIVVAIILFCRWRGAGRSVAGLALFASLGTWLPLVPVHRMPPWMVVRMLMMGSVPLVLVVALGLARIERPWLRRVAIAATLAGLALTTARSFIELREDRADLFKDGGRYAAYLIQNTAQRNPRLVFAPKAYRYAWDAYPVVVIPWSATGLKMQMVAARHGPVDVFVVRRPGKAAFRAAMRRGDFGAKYRVVGEPYLGFNFVFVRDGTLHPAE